MSESPPSPPQPDPKWTPAQWQSITADGHGVLVSAAAGSGKTAVLAERCVHMVCDAENPCEVDGLLVVTFGEAAAAEMKSRIHDRLRQRAEKTPSERMSQQLALIDQARVSTLHSFCLGLLRRHFQLVGLDPAFSVLDGQEAALLRKEVAEELFADRYVDDGAGSFSRFIDCYGEGNDSALIGRVIAVHDMLRSVVSPEKWIADRLGWLREAAEKPLAESKLGKEFLQQIDAELQTLDEQGAESVAQLRGLGRYGKMADYVGELVSTVRAWRAALPRGLAAIAAEVAAFGSGPRAPSIPSDDPSKPLVTGLMERVRKPMKTGGSIRDRLQFDEEYWQRGMAEILPHAEVLLSLVEQFEQRYAKAKSAERTVDFSDLERLSLQVLRDPNHERIRPSAIARAHHEQFQHVLVDEYQDINEVQDAILHLLSKECVAGEKGKTSNLFCVGDVKQSIYGFRLADVERFLRRMEYFRAPPAPGRRAPSGRVIDLQTNFRSRALLLQAINALFEKLMSKSAGNVDYDETHALSPGPQYPAAADESGCFTGAPVELHLLTEPESVTHADAGESAEGDGEGELDRTEREGALVARRIGELLGRDGSSPRLIVESDGSGGHKTRPIRLGDIAILLRARQFKAEQFAAALQRAGIRAHAESATGFFQTTEARDMIALLQLLDNQQQDVPMAAVLRSPLGGLPEPDEALARIRATYLDTDPPIPFHAAAVRYAREQDDELAAHLCDFLDSLAEWRIAARRRPLAELLRTVFDDSGYLAFCAGLADGEQRVANLQFLHEQAAKFDMFHRQGLPRFLAFLQSLEDESDLGAAPVASEADDVVRIMTIHRSKGLEFPVVIVPDLGKGFNVMDCRGSLLVDRTAGLGLDVVDPARFIRYRSLAGMLVESGIRQRILAEELRVLYVAATRAREHLILIGTVEKDSWEKWQQEWAEFSGVMSAEIIRDAGSMADWIGPAAACATIDGGKKAFEVIAYTPEQSAEMDVAATARPADDGRLAALADFQPLSPPPDPADMDRALKILDRISRPYPFADAVKLPAAKSVTAIAKGSPPPRVAGAASPLIAGGPSPGSHPVERASIPFPAATGASAPGYQGPLPHPMELAPSEAPIAFARKLDRPTFLDPAAAPLATERGTATHVVLEHFDFRQPASAAEIDRQIKALLAAKRITAEQEQMVDRAAIAWVLASEAGQLLQKHSPRLLREIPVYFPLATPPAADPLDRTMVRGRLDVFIPAAPGEGATIIDYKTDNVDAATIDDRAALYAGQMKLYRQAMEDITAEKVARTLLVFLVPRIVKDIE